MNFCLILQITIQTKLNTELWWNTDENESTLFLLDTSHVVESQEWVSETLLFLGLTLDRLIQLLTLIVKNYAH